MGRQVSSSPETLNLLRICLSKFLVDHLSSQNLLGFTGVVTLYPLLFDSSSDSPCGISFTDRQEGWPFAITGPDVSDASMT
jgi:hypothetical protein